MYFYKYSVIIDVLRKNQIRKLYLEKRKNLSKRQTQLFAEQINEKVLKVITSIDPNVLHCFLPIIKHNEFDTRQIIQFCWNHKIKLLVPKSNFENFEMKSVVLNHDTEIELSNLGIPEPKWNNTVHEKEIDIVITPLLAFDNLGNRVGYGKGFYDRFFKECKKDVIKIGISLFDPIKTPIDTHPNDIKLDYCITPSRIIQFN